MPTFRSGLGSGESRKPAEILPIVKSYKPIIIQFVIDGIKRSDNDQFAGDFRGRNGSAKYSWRRECLSAVDLGAWQACHSI